MGKLMTPLFIDGMFNRTGKKIRAEFVKDVTDAEYYYELYRSAGKPDRSYPENDQDRYYLYVDINGWLVHLGYTEHTLIKRCGSGIDGQCRYIHNTILRSVENFYKSISDPILHFPDFIGAAYLDQLSLCSSLSKKRQDHFRKLEAERTKEQKLEEEQKKAAAEAERQAERAKYFGWADTLSPSLFGKAQAYMEKMVCVDDKTMPRREFVVYLLKNGYTPQIKEGIPTWNRKTGVEGKPKTEYRMTDEKSYYLVSKTEYDFAMYIVEHKEAILWK